MMTSANEKQSSIRAGEIVEQKINLNSTLSPDVEPFVPVLFKMPSGVDNKVFNSMEYETQLMQSANYSSLDSLTSGSLKTRHTSKKQKNQSISLIPTQSNPNAQLQDAEIHNVTISYGNSPEHYSRSEYSPAVKPLLINQNKYTLNADVAPFIPRSLKVTSSAKGKSFVNEEQDHNKVKIASNNSLGLSSSASVGGRFSGGKHKSHSVSLGLPQRSSASNLQNPRVMTVSSSLGHHVDNYSSRKQAVAGKLLSERLYNASGCSEVKRNISDKSKAIKHSDDKTETQALRPEKSIVEHNGNAINQGKQVPEVCDHCDTKMTPLSLLSSPQERDRRSKNKEQGTKGKKAGSDFTLGDLIASEQMKHSKQWKGKRQNFHHHIKTSSKNENTEIEFPSLEETVNRLISVVQDGGIPVTNSEALQSNTQMEKNSYSAILQTKPQEKKEVCNKKNKSVEDVSEKKEEYEKTKESIGKKCRINRTKSTEWKESNQKPTKETKLIRCKSEGKDTINGQNKNYEIKSNHVVYKKASSCTSRVAKEAEQDENIIMMKSKTKEFINKENSIMKASRDQNSEFHRKHTHDFPIVQEKEDKFRNLSGDRNKEQKGDNRHQKQNTSLKDGVTNDDKSNNSRHVQKGAVDTKEILPVDHENWEKGITKKNSKHYSHEKYKQNKVVLTVQNKNSSEEVNESSRCQFSGGPVQENSEKTKKKKKKIKKRKCLPTGKVSLVTTELYSKMQGQDLTKPLMVSPAVELDIMNPEEYPALASCAFSSTNKIVNKQAKICLNPDYVSESEKAEECSMMAHVNSSHGSESDSEREKDEACKVIGSKEKSSAEKNAISPLLSTFSMTGFMKTSLYSDILKRAQESEWYEIHKKWSTDERPKPELVKNASEENENTTGLAAKKEKKDVVNKKKTKKVAGLISKEHVVDVTPNKKKSREPINISFTDILTIKEKIHKSQRQIKTERLKTKIMMNKKKINDTSERIGSVKKRGKEREKPKPKRLSALKKIIIRDREERKLRRLLQEYGHSSLSDTAKGNILEEIKTLSKRFSQDKENNSLNVDLHVIFKNMENNKENNVEENINHDISERAKDDSVLSRRVEQVDLNVTSSQENSTEDEVSVNSENKLRNKFESSNKSLKIPDQDHDEEEASSHQVSSMQNVSMHQLENLMDLPVTVSLEEKLHHMAKKKIHSRRFREYCNHVIKDEINELLKTMIQDLVRFQDRLYHKDPVKAKMKKRMIVGLREVTKYLKLKKLKCVVIAPDLERIRTFGGLDDALQKILDLTDVHNVPLVFGLTRRQLGYLCMKAVPVSCIGIFNYDGTEDTFRKILELLKEAKTEYNDLLKMHLESLKSTPGTFEVVNLQNCESTTCTITSESDSHKGAKLCPPAQSLLQSLLKCSNEVTDYKITNSDSENETSNIDNFFK
ncbi:uncharacterized protein LOC143238968 isoform X2 [Tachypleus tridentatus]|uniref:uncharacterized protein LOC143238968 isoform X2 n=1 Tax=Tachypleus tridentatus TaxID=6853 RepID=UPI003FD56A2F